MIKLYIKEWCQRQTPPIKSKELAAKIGISEVAMSNIITGNAWPAKDRLESIAQALGINANDLFVDPATKEGTPSDGVTCPKCGYHMHIEAR